MTRLLQHWVMRQAELRPDATAIVMGGERLSYGELDALSSQVAHALRAAGCGRGDRVGLLLRKSPKTVACLLGALKADACYVPLDVTSPAPRLAKIVASAEPRILLTEARAGGAGVVADVLREMRPSQPVVIGWMDTDAARGASLTPAFTLGDVRQLRSQAPPFANSSMDVAHLLFTSGSTGAPKGVMITHESVIRFVEWARGYFRLSATDRLSGHSPLHFDLSTFDLFGTFSAGAQIHLVPPALNVLPHKLAEFMRESELTQWFSVPSVLALMAQLDVVRAGDFPTLRRLLWCGEVFPTPSLRYWMTRLPNVPFTNLYGPTETTIASAYYTIPQCPADDRDAIPIGRPCAGEGLLVLDDAMRPVAPGKPGDLYIRGVGLSPGYWRDPEKTAAAFLPNPAEPGDRLYRTGDLARVGEGPERLVYFLGRNDSQVKSRGYRIELGEVEAALQLLTDLAECAVVARATEGFEGMLICCAYVLRHGASVGPLDLRKQLGALLPAYMIPSDWKAYDRLPRNANGKIDRVRIRDEWREAPATVWEA